MAELFRRPTAAPVVTARPLGAPHANLARAPLHSSADRRLREQDVQQGIERLPSLPTVVTEVLRLVRSDASSIGDLEKRLRDDMALAGKLLKLVNSRFYALPTRVGSISQAVSLVGFASLKSLVLAASASGLLATDVSAYGYAPAGLWANSIATAAIARRAALIAGHGREPAEEAFVAGLLQHVGMVVLAPILARHGHDMRRPTADLLAHERSLLGLDHRWVNARLAERWNLPSDLAWVLSRHGDAPNPALEMRLAVLQLAERMANRAGIGLGPQHPFANTVDDTLLSPAGFTPEHFAKLEAELPTLLSGASEL